ncbi:hypothetical protein VHEMI05000 [[Torrubiella] hemipterigena]|uniref:Enoyl-CoA hydratase n=1 Tax=[Torrubiella] hemipterigena TaxID=1531966 RepID=A0A0A1TFY0_9HYPO|nr:hypothetical protein VHEMI05000 [[Torrubiella] hemipterigena]
MSIKIPDTYTHFKLPTLSFAHHPASSPTVTPVIVLKLDRPEARHAFTDEMARSLITAYDTLSADDRVRAIVLTSSDESNRFFCAGMDFNAAQHEPVVEETVTSHRDGGGTVSLAMHRCTKPIVAAIRGSAVGVGITQTLPATIRVANKDAKIGFVFGRRGFCMEACSSFYLPRLIGTSRAMHLVSTAAVYPASHKLLDGLFSEVVEAHEVVPTALRLAQEIADNVSLVSLQIMKAMINQGPTSAEEAHLLESKMFYTLYRSQDAKEGVQSFLEKRPPKFTDTIQQNAPQFYPWWSPLDVKAKL